MPYALVIVDKNQSRDAWPEGLDFYAHRLPKEEGVQKTGEGAWLVNLDTDLLVLAQIVRLAHEAHMPYHAVFFDQKPNVCSSSIQGS